MEDLVLKYKLLDATAQQTLLDFLDYLLQKQSNKQNPITAKENKDELVVAIDKMSSYAQKQGLTEDTLNQILNEE